MPVVSSKISPQELDSVAEYANRHGITISNLIRMVLVREVSSPKLLAKADNQQAFSETPADSALEERPRKKTLMEALAAESRARRGLR